jgi:tellurite resistance protein
MQLADTVVQAHCRIARISGNVGQNEYETGLQFIKFISIGAVQQIQELLSLKPAANS